MRKFDEICAEARRKRFCGNELVEFFIIERAKLLEELCSDGKSLEEANEKVDVLLLKSEIEKLKRGVGISTQIRIPPLDSELWGASELIDSGKHYPIGGGNKPASQKETEKALADPTSHNKKSGKKSGKEITTRQMVLLLLALMYGNPEVPDSVIKTDVSGLLESFKDLDVTNIYKYVLKATGAKPGSIKERQSLIKDLRVVSEQLRLLGIHKMRWKEIDEKIKLLETQIQSIESFKQEDEEEKRNNW
jgi:hypothetical protein